MPALMRYSPYQKCIEEIENAEFAVDWIYMHVLESQITMTGPYRHRDLWLSSEVIEYLSELLCYEFDFIFV